MYIALLLFALVEALTEFLPISSTAHLIILTWVLRYFGLFLPIFEAWQVFIQLGAVLALITYFLPWLRRLVQLAPKIGVSLLPVLVGYAAYSFIRGVLFHNLLVISLALVFGGVAILWVERQVNSGRLKLGKSMSDLSYKDALLAGLFQILAFVPGVSRSGAVIIGMMLLGYRRKDAVEYSFLLGVPTLFGAGLLDLFKQANLILGSAQSVLWSLAGLGLTFLFSLIVIRWFLGYASNKPLTLFGWYRIVLGGVLLVALVV